MSLMIVQRQQKAGEEIEIKSSDIVDIFMHLLALHKVKGNLTIILILSKGF
jgi:hypothetical protein|tara:strand:+ start:301 stop:453 length:153 start_codon:yes stop_codon:yes gene_type:complete